MTGRDGWLINVILVVAILWGLGIAYFILRDARVTKKKKGRGKDKFSTTDYDASTS